MYAEDFRRSQRAGIGEKRPHSQAGKSRPARRAEGLRMLLAGLFAWGSLLVAQPARAIPPSSVAAAPVPRTAFFYGRPVPPELFAHYDRVVVEPSASPTLPKPGTTRGEAFAYVSVGEVDESLAYRKGVAKEWLFGRNQAWKSDIVDLTQKGWQTFVVDRIVAPLWALGYRGFFLDTLDSFESVVKTDAARLAQEQALGALLMGIVQRFPDVKLILNRGFPVVRSVKANVVGFVAESLFQSYDAGKNKYGSVTQADREWLLPRLLEVRDKFNIPVTVVDYVPRTEHALRQKTARAISSLGFDAWVSNGALDDLGVGQVEVIPRRILLVYDGVGRLSQSDAHVVIAAIIERMGYAVDYASVADPLPPGNVSARYAGVVTFLTSEVTSTANAYRNWLLARVHEKTPVAIIGPLGFTADVAFARELDLALSRSGYPTAFSPETTLAGFEAKLSLPGKEIHTLRIDGAGFTPMVRVKDEQGEVADAVFVAPWGGMASDPFVMTGGGSESRRFILDPWTFLKSALKLPSSPVLDLTTDAGRRILTSHIDGDGFASRAEVPGTPYAGQVIYDQILTKYRIPATVSIIEGEIGPEGVRPKEAPELEKIARATFRLPFVEIASHAFSHAFYWNKAESHELVDGKAAHLPVPNYRFDLAREIFGSANYINSRLAPPGKRVAMFLWTGDCLPSGDAVAMTRAAGLWNMNGGGSTQTFDSPSQTQLEPVALPFPNGALQVYGPIQNDNIFSNHWLGPYYGFRRVIETFKLTESPRRLTPISIYYHYFSGTKVAGVRALMDVYDYALAQETHPLYESEYAARVEAFVREATVALAPDGTWEVAALGANRSLITDLALGYPDLALSKGVAGFRDVRQGDDVRRYVHLTAPHAEIRFSPRLPQATYLVHSNAAVVSWASTSDGARIRLRGHMPIVFGVAGARRRCTLKREGREVQGRATVEATIFSLPDADTGDALLACR